MLAVRANYLNGKNCSKRLLVARQATRVNFVIKKATRRNVVGPELDLDRELQEYQRSKELAKKADEELAELAQMRKALEEEETRLDGRQYELTQMKVAMEERGAQLDERQFELAEKEIELNNRLDEVNRREAELAEAKLQLAAAALAPEPIEEEMEANNENISPVYRTPESPKECRYSTIEEEERDDLVPSFNPTTPRSFPRQSIGQWSVERLRNNMSVKSLVSSLEDKTNTKDGARSKIQK